MQSWDPKAAIKRTPNYKSFDFNMKMDMEYGESKGAYLIS